MNDGPECQSGASTQTHLHTLRTNMRAIHTFSNRVCTVAVSIAARIEFRMVQI